MKLKKVIALATMSVLLISSLAGCGSKGGSYPSKNVNVIVPFGAGGNTDMSNPRVAEYRYGAGGRCVHLRG